MFNGKFSFRTKMHCTGPSSKNSAFTRAQCVSKRQTSCASVRFYQYKDTFIVWDHFDLFGILLLFCCLCWHYVHYSHRFFVAFDLHFTVDGQRAISYWYSFVFLWLEFKFYYLHTIWSGVFKSNLVQVIFQMRTFNWPLHIFLFDISAGLIFINTFDWINLSTGYLNMNEMKIMTSIYTCNY